MEDAPLTRSETPEAGEHLFALLARGARRASDAQLAAAVILGLLGVGAIVSRPSATWWKLLFPFACLAAFGAWGIADRVARERAAVQGPAFTGRGALAAARWVTLGIGVLAALATGLLAMGEALGVIKS